MLLPHSRQLRSSSIGFSHLPHFSSLCESSLCYVNIGLAEKILTAHLKIFPNSCLELKSFLKMPTNYKSQHSHIPIKTKHWYKNLWQISSVLKTSCPFQHPNLRM
jgi:hypothetical protein